MNRSRAAVICICIGVLLATFCQVVAEYVVPPVPERISQARTIVVGTLRNVVVETRDGSDYETGVIEVLTVLHGTVVPGDRLEIQWKNVTDEVCPRTGHPQAQDRLALWLLDPPENGMYRGRYPEYTVVLEPESGSLELFQHELREAKAKGELAPVVRKVWEYLKRAQWENVQ